MFYKVANPGRPTSTVSENYHMNLVVQQGTLRILKGAPQNISHNDDETLYYFSTPGMNIDAQWPDIADRSGDDVIFLYGYIGDRMNELAAVKFLLSAREAHSLLRSVACPTRRELASFEAHRPLPEDSLEISSVPINLGRREVLNSLRHDIEFIQGPPGTGKKGHCYVKHTL